MEDKENYEEFVDELKTRNDPVENWPINKLKKEAGDEAGQGQSKEKDDLGIGY